MTTETADATIAVTVSELVDRIRLSLRDQVGLVRVSGELSNVSRPASGHCYFTLKDEDAQIRCVMFRSNLQRVSFTPVDGLQVVVAGHVDVYQARGTLQVRALSMQAAGAGALQQAFETLKRRLEAEGLFDQKRKRPLPSFPGRIGIVTSETGAAIRDVLDVLARRYPLVDVVLCPVPVQGADASAEIASAITALNRLSAHCSVDRIDLVIVGRGGGSTEDLWAFNEEPVARAIFASSIPVISAVGHQTDFSIADFVADVRAPTPSAAAEIAVPDRLELAEVVTRSTKVLEAAILRMISHRRQQLTHAVHSRGMTRPSDRIEQLQIQLDDLFSRMTSALQSGLHRKLEKATSLKRHIEALGPSKTMSRGYARIERDGKAVTSAGSLHADDEVTLRFVDGGRHARILDSEAATIPDRQR